MDEYVHNVWVDGPGSIIPANGHPRTSADLLGNRSESLRNPISTVSCDPHRGQRELSRGDDQPRTGSLIDVD